MPLNLYRPRPGLRLAAVLQHGETLMFIKEQTEEICEAAV